MYHETCESPPPRRAPAASSPAKPHSALADAASSGAVYVLTANHERVAFSYCAARLCVTLASCQEMEDSGGRGSQSSARLPSACPIDLIFDA